MTCDLIFLNPQERLTPEQEKARYDLHSVGGAGNEGHQAFLAPLVDEVMELLEKSRWKRNEVAVLDYGSGPAGFLSLLFQHKDIQTTNYDAFYAPDQSVLKRPYNVVTSTEVWEHFYFPYSEINQQIHLIKPNGYLAVMTSSHKGEAAFHDWYYRRDPTHVSFFSEKTMQWIAQRWGLQLVKAKSPYWIFRK